MNTVTKVVFLFDELSEEAKEKAYRNFSDRFYTSDHGFSEIRATLDKFARLVDIKIIKFRYNAYSHYAEYDDNNDEGIAILSGTRLMAYVYNRFYTSVYTPKYLKHKDGKALYSRFRKEYSCPFTGCCYDMDILDCLVDVMNGKYAANEYYTFADMIHDCVYSLGNSAEKEQAAIETVEYFGETVEANDYYFTENGTEMFHANELDQQKTA